MTVHTASDAASGTGGNLAAAEAEVTRLRLGLEGSRPFRLADGSTLTPRMEIGLRRDGGDAETGFGVEIGAGIVWQDAERGLGAELRGHGLLAHEAKGFRERGISGSFTWDPMAGGRGPQLTLTQTVGASFSGGTDALLERTTLAGLAANDNGHDCNSGGWRRGSATASRPSAGASPRRRRSSLVCLTPGGITAWPGGWYTGGCWTIARWNSPWRRSDASRLAIATLCRSSPSASA